MREHVQPLGRARARASLAVINDATARVRERDQRVGCNGGGGVGGATDNVRHADRATMATFADRDL